MLKEETNILLIKARYIYKKIHPVHSQNIEKALPIGLAYITGLLDNEGYRIRVVDYNVSDTPITEILKNFQSKIVGISFYSLEYKHAEFLFHTIKEYDKNIITIGGGPHPNTIEEKLLENNPDIDFLVVREGEQTILELVQEILGSHNYSAVKGIIYRNNGQIIETEPREFIKNLDVLPKIPFHHFDIRKYFPQAGSFRRLPSHSIVTARGCPYKCNFCNLSLWGKTIRYRSAENVLAEVDYAVQELGAKEINFCDETFTINRNRALDICKGIIEGNYKIKWKCSTRVDRLDRELLKMMKKAGCFVISLGIESGDNEILNIINKGFTTEHSEKSVKLLREIGIQSAGFFMFNLPWDTMETMERTIRFSRSLDLDYLNFEMTKPFYGTEIRKYIEENEGKLFIINKKLWNKWEHYSVGNHIFFRRIDIPEEWIKKRYVYANRQFYLNPKILWRQLKNVRSYSQVKVNLLSFYLVLRTRVYSE